MSPPSRKVGPAAGRVKQGSTKLQSDLDFPWAADDRIWFEAHPHRSHRLRRSYPEEWVLPHSGKVIEPASHTVVRQLGRGVRVRQPIGSWPDSLPNAETAPEEAAWALFDLVSENRSSVPFSTVQERMRLLAKGGRA
jgi:hypothetical protein